MLRSSILLLFVLLLGCSSRNKRPEAMRVEHATSALEQLSQSSNGIPDAVLNLTRCAVLIPSASGGESTTTGVAICRESQGWGSPWQVTFRGTERGQDIADLVFLILNDAGARNIRSGHLQITSSKTSPAPLVNTSPIPNQRDLARETLCYVLANGVLLAGFASGVVTGPETTATTIRSSSKVTEHYTSALVSFFNRIHPTGIVIHHTALLPNEGTLPRDKSDVDEYHASRGFEIICAGRTYHVAYHYLILPNGRIQSGRPETCQGAHAPGYNSYLGISIVGDFSSRDNPNGKKGLPQPTSQQIASLLKLCRELQGRYRIPLQHIVRHSDVSSTQCPGDRFPFASVLNKLAEAPTSGVGR